MKTLTLLSVFAASALAATSTNPCPKETRPDLPDTPFVVAPGQSYDFESAKTGDAGILKIAVPADIRAYVTANPTSQMWFYADFSDNNGAGTGVKWNACYPEVGVAAVVPDKPCNDSAAVGTTSGSQWGSASGDNTGSNTMWFDVAANFGGGALEDTIYVFLNPVCSTTQGCVKTNEWNVNAGFSHAKVASSSDAFMYWGYDNLAARPTGLPRSEFELKNNVRTSTFKTKTQPGQDQFVYFTGTTTAADQPVYVNVRVPVTSKNTQLELYIGNQTFIDVTSSSTYKYPQFAKYGNWDNYENPFKPAVAGTYQMAIKTVHNDDLSIDNWVKWTAKAGYGTPPCDSAATVGASALLFALMPLTWLFNRL